MRGKSTPKRKINPDPKFQSQTIAKFINYVMRRGKKSVAQKIVYEAFEVIKEKTGQDPLHIFNQAIKKVAPILEVKSRRRGGATYQVPIQVRGDRKLTLALRWIIEAAKKRQGKAMRERLAQELIEAASEIGEAIKKRQTIQRMAEANRAFAHFRW